MTRTLSIMNEIASGVGVSPADFSLSVHNALVGLLSIHTQNANGHTAVASGLDTFGHGMIESLARLAENPEAAVLYCFGDAPLPGPYADFPVDEPGLPLVLGMLLRSSLPGDNSILFEAEPKASADCVEDNVAEAFLRFFSTERRKRALPASV